VIGVLAAATLFLAPRAASAQARSGDKEVLIAGNFFSLSSPGGNSFSNGQFLFGVGYFATDRVEIGVRPTFNVRTTSTPARPAVRIGNIVIDPGAPASTDVDVDGGVSTSVQYFFGESSAKTKPYVGGQLNVNSFKTQNGGSFGDNLFTQALFGVKNYISERAALDFSGAYGFRPNAASDFQLFSVQVGITVLF
jgi:hypothetical protein